MAPPKATHKAPPKPKASKQLTHEQLQDKAIAQLTKDNERSKTAGRADQILKAFEFKIMARAESWETAARNIGSAYSLAAKRHTEAIAKQNNTDALRTQALFSVLTVAASGALSWISSGMQAGVQSAEVKILIEAGEDVAQAGAGEAFSALGPMLVASPHQAVSEDPQIFQNQRANVVSEAKRKIFERFAKIHLDWAATPLEKWDGYDEAKQQKEYSDLEARADALAGGDKLPSVDDMADELERGIWAKWMPGLKSSQFLMTKVSSAVEERLDKLGILRVADVAIHFWQSADYEDKKLIAWANGYKVKDFLSMKQAQTK